METQQAVHFGIGSALATEKHYTVREIARMWGISERRVHRLFVDEPDVLVLSFPTVPKKLRKHRPKAILRIPVSVVERLRLLVEQSDGTVAWCFSSGFKERAKWERKTEQERQEAIDRTNDLFWLVTYRP